MAHSFDWLATRQAAMQHVCPFCHAAVGDICRNLATPKRPHLQDQPAHYQRIMLAQDAARGDGDV